MEHVKAQRRRLICAALFSFGSLCGTLTVFNLSASSLSLLSASVCSFFSINPLLFIVSAAFLGPFLMLISASSLFGVTVICCISLFCGFFGGAFEFLAIKNACYPLATASFLLLSSFCIIQIGGCMLRFSFSFRRQAVCSGLSKPDYSFDMPRIIAAFVVLLLASSAFAWFIRSM